MPLTNFGAILNFAETMEKDDMDFYVRAAGVVDAAGHGALFEALAGEGKKHIALVQRTRRENVTEMILEPVRDFSRDAYQVVADDPGRRDGAALLKIAAALEKRAVRYYSDAADKIRALPEVSRALKTLAKHRAKRLGRIESRVG